MMYEDDDEDYADYNSDEYEDNDDDDERIFQADLLESKRKRSKADENAQILRNRIKMLEMEEQKAQKKLSKTKNKMSEVMELKKKKYIKERKKQDVIVIIYFLIY